MNRVSVIGRLARIWVTFCALLVCGRLAAHAETSAAKEYQVKAAFLYNFTKFTEWPAGSFASERAPIVIGILGKNPFGDELEKIVRGRTVNGRPLTVVQFSAAGEVHPGPGGCHLLFVAASEERRTAAWADLPAGPGLLTVGESAAFAAAGGMINFMVVEDKARFEINLKAAEQSGLKLSAQLLKLAVAIRR